MEQTIKPKGEFALIKFLNLHPRTKRFFLWIYYIMECIGGIGIISGSLIFLSETLQAFQTIGFWVSIFYFGIIFTVDNFAVNIINTAYYNMMDLQEESKNEKMQKM